MEADSGLKEFEFENAITNLDEMNYPKYTFVCTCQYSKNENPTSMLCEHQIAALNKKCIDEMLFDERYEEGNILTQYFKCIKFEI